jgi:hypothetical protein
MPARPVRNRVLRRALARPSRGRGGAATATATGSGTISASLWEGRRESGLALFLGFIPGVGAIYNGQYSKGLVHAVIFGVLISILNSSPSSLQVIFGILLPVWIFYMAFEAYHTARKRQAGEPVDEYSSIINLGGHPSNAPVAGVVLVVLGVLLLLDTLHIFDFEYLTRYWPVLLIAAGVYLLYSRFAGSSRKEVSHER